MPKPFCAAAAEPGYLREQVPQRGRGPSLVQVDYRLTPDCLEALRSKARLAVVVGKLWELKTIAGELFEEVSVEFEVDPDVPGSHFLVFNVTARGEVKEIAGRRQEWHRRTHGVLEDKSDLVRLMIDVA